MSKEKTLVAVYGSLRKGMGNSGLLHGVKMLGTTKTKPIYRLFGLYGYPGIKPGNDEITIEVYETDSELVLARLDRLEGYSPLSPKEGLYDKELTDTEFGKAYIYTYNGREPEGRYIPSGDWVEHLTKLRESRKTV